MSLDPGILSEPWIWAILAWIEGRRLISAIHRGVASLHTLERIAQAHAWGSPPPSPPPWAAPPAPPADPAAGEIFELFRGTIPRKGA